MELLFDQIKVSKKKLYLGFSKSCLFILNNDNSHSYSKNEFKKFEKDIKYILKGEDDINEKNKEDINLCFFNAKYYINYCNIFNYFNNLKRTLDIEYKEYLRYKQNIYKYPEMFGGKMYNTFYDFLFNKQLNDKIKKEFKKNIKKIMTYSIKNDIVNDLSEELSKYLDMNEIFQNGDKIYKVLSFAQDNIDKLPIFKESNIENFKKILLTQIQYLYKSKNEELNNNLKESLSMLDEFINFDFENNKKNLKEIKEFTKKIIELKLNIKEIYTHHENTILGISYQTRKDIFEILEKRKKNLENDIRNISNEINEEVNQKLKKFNDDIKQILNYMNDSYHEIYKKCEEMINMFSEGKIHMKLFKDFNNYLLSKIGDENKNLEEFILKDMIFNINLSEIYNKKGFIELFKSFISKQCMLENNIDIIKHIISKKFTNFKRIIIYHLIKYNQKFLFDINFAFNLASAQFTEEQQIIFEEIKNYYNNLKIKIQEAKLI